MARGLAMTIGLIEVDPDRYGGWPGIMRMCERDARDMARLLEAERFSCDTLLTAQATRAAVIAGIRSAAATLVAGDLFVLFYSGHGGVVPDLNNDEANQSDQTWCLYDGQLVDDQLSSLWSEFAAGTRIVVLSDSCYSGSIVRLAEREGKPDRTCGFVKAMPRAIARKTYEADKASYDEIIGHSAANGSPAAIEARVLLISACEDDTEAYEGPDNGVFTAGLKQIWNEGRFGGSYARLHADVTAVIDNGQIPVMMRAGVEVPDLGSERALHI